MLGWHLGYLIVQRWLLSQLSLVWWAHLIHFGGRLFGCGRRVIIQEVIIKIFDLSLEIILLLLLGREVFFVLVVDGVKDYVQLFREEFVYVIHEKGFSECELLRDLTEFIIFLGQTLCTLPNECAITTLL